MHEILNCVTAELRKQAGREVLSAANGAHVRRKPCRCRWKSKLDYE